MEYHYSDVPMSDDPFGILETDLDDVHEVISNNVSYSSWDSHPQMHPSTAYQSQQPPPQQRQLTPPGAYYDQRNREIGSIVSLLQSDDSPPRDYPMHFSPPNFSGGMGHPQQQHQHMQQHQQQQSYYVVDHGNSPSVPLSPTTTMLGQMHFVHNEQQSPSTHNGHQMMDLQPGSLAHHLAAPAMQPLGNMGHGGHGSPPMEPMVHSPTHSIPSPPHMYVDTSPVHQPQQQHLPQQMQMPHRGLLAPSVKPELTELVVPKQEPKELLVTLLEAERLCIDPSLDATTPTTPTEQKTSSRPSGVALRVSVPPPTMHQRSLEYREEEEDEDDERDDDEGAPPVKKGPKTERRTAHNLIEKKYRCSINDRIQQMKVMLAGDEAKLSKSATLRRGIEHICLLERQVGDLQAEVVFLRELLDQNSITIPPLPLRPHSPLDLDREFSSPTSGATSPTQMQSAQTSPVSSPRAGTKRSRPVDQSRVALFAVMMAVLVWNPLTLFSSSVVAHSPINEHSHGRVLRSVDGEAFEHGTQDGDWWTSNIVRPMFIWTVNAFVVICVLTRLLVYGEPVQDFKSRTWAEFVSVRTRATDSLEKGLLKEAHRFLADALQILDRPLPSAGIDEGVSIVWQIIRHMLNSVWIGRWMARRRRNAEKPVTVVCKSHAHTALVYHQLHQLHLLCPSDFHSSLSGLHLSLSAVNLAESAGASIDGLPRAQIASIYLGAALSVRLHLPRYVSSMASAYFIRRAKRHIRRADPNTVSGLVWVLHPLARRFLGDSERVRGILSGRHADAYPFAALTDTVNALDKLRDAFKSHLLSVLLEQCRNEGDPNCDVADVSQLLLSLSTAVSVSPEMEKVFHDPFCRTLSSGDPICTWWTHVLTCALYWKIGQSGKAKTHYSLVRQCPKELLGNPLALAVGHAFCSRKLCIDDRNNAKFAPLVSLHSRKALEALRTVVARPSMPNVKHIQEGLRALSYEWVMSSVLDGWRYNLDQSRPYWTNKQTSDFRVLYQEAYNHYQFIADQRQGSELKCSVYRLTCRMLNGANPVHTYTALLRARRETQNRDASTIVFRREDAPDRYHMHVLTKLHTDINSMAAKVK